MHKRTYMARLAPFIGLCFAMASASPPPEIIALTTSPARAQPRFNIIDFPPELLSRMKETTWRPGCPVPLEDLRLLNLSYWDLAGLPSAGLLIVNKAVVVDILFIFDRLFKHGFMIDHLQPVEDYGGSDDRSMAANNTSAFNCRDVAGKPGRFSNHSWGRAVDINPLTNPMLLHGQPLPPEGSRFLDRAKAAPGSILEGSFIVKLFQSRGWTWGGAWENPDFQHFEKPQPHRN